MKFLFVIMIFFTATFVAKGDERPPQAPPPKVRLKSGDYEAARLQAVKSNRPLIVWVGDAKPCFECFPDCSTVYVKEFFGSYSGVVIGVPDGMGNLDRIDLPANTNYEKIKSTYDRPKTVYSTGGYTSGNCSGGG